MSRISLANHFKQQAFEVIGLNPQRMGQQLSQITATGVEQAAAASYAQTEIFFIQHCDYLMPRVHQMRTDVAQFYNSTKPSARLTYITGADEKVNFEIKGTDLLMRDLNIFCTTTANHRAILDQLKGMAMNNNTTGASIFDLGQIVQADSIAQLNTVLKASEAKQSEQKQQEQQSAQQMQEQQIQAKAEEERLRREYEESNAEKDRQNQVLIAEIKAAGYGAMADINKNEESDFSESMKEIRQSEQYQEQMSLAREKQSNENVRSNQKIDIEREKLGVQRDIAQTQLEIARENKNKFDSRDSKKKK
jgi:hypothetical protein